MAQKLLDAAQERWRNISAPHLAPLVRAGAAFIDGQQHHGRTSNHIQENTAA